MKKLLLLFAAGSFATVAFAQSANVSMVKIDYNSSARPQSVPTSAKPALSSIKTKYANKSTGTVGGSRVYNYLDYLSVINPAILNNDTYPYMWHHNDVLGIYGNGSGGTEADTIRFSSYAMTLDPTLPGFNDGTAFPGTIAINKNNSYTVDSVRVYGIYGRNRNITSTVDTLRFSFVYGNGTGTNLPVYFYSGMQANFGSDTVRFASIQYDATKNIAARTSTSTPTVVVKDVYLQASDTAVTSFAAKVGDVTVPAGQFLGVTVSFKSGEVVPALDTIFLGSLNPNMPFKHGMFRPQIFEENSGSYPTYTPGHYNTGFVKFLPDTGGYAGLYLPSYAFVAAFQDEIPNIDVRISCATCFQTAVPTVTNIISKSEAYPNPAYSEVVVPFTISRNANVTVTLANAMGQVVNTQKMGNLTSGQAVFPVSNLADGIYFYTIQADEHRTTGRVVVAH